MSENPKKSLTPPILVDKPGEENQLSPNPAGFGFTKQIFVDSLPASGEVNALYAKNVYNPDGSLLGYLYYTWSAQGGFAYAPFAVASPNTVSKDGGRSQKAVVVNPEREMPEKVYNGVVVFKKEPYVKGMLLSEYVDKHGGVTHEELAVAIAGVPHVSFTEGTGDDLGFVDEIKIDDEELEVVTPSKVVPSIKGADVPDGAVIKVLAIDETGKMVKADAPSGTVVVDGALSDSSENPVQNKVVKAALDLKADAEDVYTKTEVDETYAKQDGDYAVAGLRAKSSVTAETANQLLATKSVVDKVPYLHRTSGGSADIGNRSSGSVVGGSVVVNQQLNQNAPVIPFGSTIDGITINLVENQIVLNGTATDDIDFSFYATIHNNHIYLRRNLRSNGFGLYFSYSLDDISVVQAIDDNPYLALTIINGTILNNVVYPGYCVDLTQALGETIADYIYDLEVANAGAGVAWFNTHFPNYPLGYNVGTLTHVEGLVSHDMIGFNQYNGDYAIVIANNKYCISGDYTDLEFALTEEGATSAVSITTENGHDYFTPTKNGFVFVNGAGANTCINLSWSGTKDGEYEDYVKHSYPLDNGVILRGIPKLDMNNKLYYDGDIYSKDGKVARRYKLVDMGSLSWTYNASSPTHERFVASVSGTKLVPAETLGNLRCVKYVTATIGNVYIHASDKIIGKHDTTNQIWIYDSAYTDATAFKTAMSGVYLLYEVATPAEETFDPFIDPQTVVDWGTEEFVVETPLIPVGHDTRYPINVLDKVQNAPDTPGIDGDFIMRYQVNGRVATYVKLSESPVITDCKIRGKLCVLNNNTAIALGTEDFTKFDRASTSGSGVGVTVDNAHCTFTITTAGEYEVFLTYSSKSSVDDVVFDLGIFNNNVIVPELTQIRRNVDGSDIGQATIHYFVNLAAGDVLDFRAKPSIACNSTVRYFSWTIRKVD